MKGFDGPGTGPTRVFNVRDAGFAFSMTPLVVSIAGSPGRVHASARLRHERRSRLRGPMLSFFLIATGWGAHRRLFSPIRRHDETPVRFNNDFRSTLALTPFLVCIPLAYGPDGGPGPQSLSAELAVFLSGSAPVAGALASRATGRHSKHGRRLGSAGPPDGRVRLTARCRLRSVALLSALVSELRCLAVILSGRRLPMRRRPRTITGGGEASPR